MDINIEKLVQERIEDMDMTGLARDEIRDHIRRNTVVQIQKIIEEEVRAIIKEEIAKVMAGEVKTDDGWGKKETYPSFEDLFKQVFQKKMNDSWDAKREIERQVAAKVDALVKGEMNAVVSKIVDALIKAKG